MNPSACISASVVCCAVCGKRGPWFASCHVHRPGVRVQLFAEGATLYTQPSVLVAPVCGPTCANEVALVLDCPVYDKDGNDLHSWLQRWRSQQKTRRAA